MIHGCEVMFLKNILFIWPFQVLLTARGISDASCGIFHYGARAL